MLKVGEDKFRVYLKIVIPVVLLCSIVLGVYVSRVRFDYNFENFYPTDDEDTRYYFEFREQFESENDFLLAAIPAPNGSVFDKQFLSKVDRFTRDLEKNDLVTYVLSLTNQHEYFLYPDGSTSQKKYIDVDDLNPARDSARIFKNKELINALIAKDASAVGIYIRHQDYLSKKKSDLLINRIEALAKKHAISNLKLSGRTVGQKYYIETMSSELLLFLGLSAVLIIIFLAVAFRSVWGIVLPQVIIFLSLIWVLGGLGIFDLPINVILVVLPSIMFIVSMSDAIHLMSRYLDALRTEDTPYKAMLLAVNEVGLATFLTSVTTAIGFLTLYFVKVQPIQVFGIVMGIGVMVAYVLTFALLPVLFYYFPGPKHVIKSKKDHFWKKHLEKWFVAIIRNPKRILFATGVVVAISLIGLVRITPNNYLMEDINPEEPLKQDFDYIDTVFGGVRPYTLVVTLKDAARSVWDREVLQELDTVQRLLEEVHDVQVRTSLVNAVKVLNRGSHAGMESYYAVPESKSKIRSIRRSLRIANKGEFLAQMLDSTETVLVIGGTMPDMGNQAVRKRHERFFRKINQRKAAELFNFRVTGSAYLVDKNLSYLASSMVQGLTLSILIISLILGFIFRSVRAAVIGLIPNLVPLVVIAGIMGFYGIELKTSTAIIFTIAFGIAVDDTIHFLGKFKHELMKGKGKMYALKRSYLTTGKAMILTTLILCSGFMLLLLSGFMGTFYMGLLLCITLFVALIADMTLLPVLLLLFYKEKNPQKKRFPESDKIVF